MNSSYDPVPQRKLLGCVSVSAADMVMLRTVCEYGDMTLLDDFALTSIDESGRPKPDILFADLGSKSEITATELTDLIAYCLRIGAKMLFRVDLDTLDAWIADLPLDHCQVVVGNDPADILLALSMIRGARTMSKVADPAKPSEIEALDRISSELAHYARALSRMARAEGSGMIAPDHMADKGTSYRGPPPSPFLPSGLSEAEASIDPTRIRELIRLRRLRERFFDAELFADPAWDILLDLMAARLEGTKVSVSSLCIAAAVPATTALRWIKSMTDAGYLERRADPTDARRVYIALSEDAARKLGEYLRHRFTESGR